MVVVQGNAPHDRPCSLVGHLIGNRASFLCTKAPMLRVPDEFSGWHSQDPLGAKPVASSRHQSNARLAGHGANGFCLPKLMSSGDTKSAAHFLLFDHLISASPLKSMKATVLTGARIPISRSRHTRCRLLCPMRP